MSEQKPTCETCRFANRTQAVGQDNAPIIGQFILHCHFAPPTALLVQTAPGVIQQSASFPPVTPEMLCAQYQPADNKPPLQAV